MKEELNNIQPVQPVQPAQPAQPIQPAQPVQQEKNIKTAGSLFIRFFISFIILQVLISLIFALLKIDISIILNKFMSKSELLNVMLYNKFSFNMIIFYLLVFIYYFIYYYFVSFLAFHDTFLKRRVVKSDEKENLVLYVSLLTTFIYFVFSLVYYFFINQNTKFLTTYIVLFTIVTSISMALAIFVNTKKIKVG